MSLEAWLTFATFWTIFVVTPGPNAVNCITRGMQTGVPRGYICVAAILCQAFLFLWGAALGVTALIVASPGLFLVIKIAGAILLIGLGVKGWVQADKPPPPAPDGGGLFWGAFFIATINAKSLAGYVAAFSQFVQPGVPVITQMWVILPTALTLTALSYATYVTLGAWLGKRALGAVFNLWFRRILALCFILYGVALMLVSFEGA